MGDHEAETDAWWRRFADAVRYVAALEPAAGAGQKELAAAVGKVGATCKSCHDDYRAKD